MHTLKIEKKSIITTISETIYKNSDLSDVHIIIPKTIDGMEISETNVIMEYVLPIDKSSNYAILKLNDKNYRDRWLEYTIRPTDGIVISSQPGEVLFRLLINNKKIENGKINITPVAMEETISDVTSEELLSIAPTSTATASLMSFDQSSVITFDNYNDYNDYDYYTICDDGRYPVYREYMDDFDYSVIEGKDIRLTPYQLNISQEENSQYISFRMNRFADGIDRLDKKIEIRYINPDGKKDSATPVNLSYNNFYITFGWLISANVTFVSGNIKFWLQVDGVNEKNENYVWKTKVNSDMNVLPCLDGDGIIEPTDPDWYSNIVRVENAKMQEVNDVIEQAVDSITRSITATTQALSVVEIANASATTADNSANAANSAADRVENVIADVNDAIITANNSAEAANIAANSVEKAIDSANAGAAIAYSAAEEARNEAVNASTATRNAISATESANIAAGAATKAADSLQVAVDAAEQAQISQAAAEAVRDYMLKEKDSFTGYDRRYTNINFANAIIGTASGNGSVSVSDAWSAPLYNLAVDGKGVQKTTTGAQLLPFAYAYEYTTSSGITVKINANGNITLNGTSTAASSHYLCKGSMSETEAKGAEIITLSAGTYTLKATGVTGVTFRMQPEYDEGTNYTGTFSADGNYVFNLYISSGITLSNVTIYPMLNAGSTSLPWESYTGGMSSPNPNYPQEIQSVGDGEVMEVVSSVGGRNYLLNTKTYSYVGKAITNQTVYPFTFAEGTLLKSFKLDETIAISFDWEATGTDISGTFRPQVNNTPYALSFIVPEYNDIVLGTTTTGEVTTIGCAGFYDSKNYNSYAGNITAFGFRLNNVPATVTLTIKNLKFSKVADVWTPAPEDVTEKNQADYLPYLFKAQVPAVLRGIDDVRDKLECRDGVWGIWRYIGILQSSDFTFGNANDTWPVTYPGYTHVYKIINTWKIGQTRYLSNKFKCTTETNQNFNSTSLRVSTGNNALYLFIENTKAGILDADTSAERLTKINAWMKDNPFYVVYQLATPVWEPLPDYIQLQLNSLVIYPDDTSCVYVTGTDVVPDMKVNYVQDTNKVIQELRTAIIALGGAT